MIEYYVDHEKRYLSDSGKSYTEAEYSAMKTKTEAKDEEYGYRDRMAGYYDKWYRYNRADNGAAYDRGCARAAASVRCAEMVTIIPCLH